MLLTPRANRLYLFMVSVSPFFGIDKIRVFTILNSTQHG